MVLFKIRRKSDGRFSGGGARPKFTKRGKVWNEAHLKQHMSMVYDPFYGHRPYTNCEVVKYECTEVETFSPETFVPDRAFPLLKNKRPPE